MVILVCPAEHRVPQETGAAGQVLIVIGGEPLVRHIQLRNSPMPSRIIPVSSEGYDLILLDIEMPGISGMEIPQQVKGFLPNARIIFVTSHTEYAIDAFELSIFRYVPKNNLETKLTAAITDAAKLIELEAGQEYTIQTANHMEKIPYKDIFYIQRDGKNSSIVSSVGTSKVRKSLQRVFDELNAPEFIFIDRGYIVNIVQIMKVSDSIAILKNGDQLPISRSHLQEVKRQINQFWGAHI